VPGEDIILRPSLFFIEFICMWVGIAQSL